MSATTGEMPRPYGRSTSSVVSFVVAMNRVDVVDLDVDLVDVDLDVDLVDVDLDVVPFCARCPAGGLDLEKSYFVSLFNFLQVAKVGYLVGFEPREYARQLSFEKCSRMHQSTSQMDVWSSNYDLVNA